jgi:hypothetical protein
MSLANTTFLLAVRIDSNDRLMNLTRCLRYILGHFSGAKAVVIENGPHSLVGPALEAVAEHADRIYHDF